MHVKSTLTNLFNKAAQTKPAQAFLRHSGKIAGLSFAAGDIVLIAKDYFSIGRTPDPAEQMSGIAFLFSDLFLCLMDRHPKMREPAGLSIILGSLVLGYSGLGKEGQNAQIFASTMIAAQGVALILEGPLHNFANRMSSSGKGLLSSIFKPLAKYPVLTTSTLDLVLSKSALLYAGIVRRDIGLIAASVLWIAGSLGFMASDSNLQALKKDTPNLPARP